ncbi:MAG: hypothetical protein IT301_06210 [Dehalococcoidia bacterium]|nr:hypothetical protein [Dehalococcoidia bacterium]
MLAIFRHGGGANAESFPSEGIVLRARVKATKRQLASMSGTSTRSIDEAVKELQQQSYLVASEALKRSAARSWSIAYDHPLHPRRATVAHQNVKSADPCATVAHHSDSSRAQAIGGGDELTHQSNNPDAVDPPPPSFSQVPREKLLRTLRSLDVQRPATVLASFGNAKVLGALAMLHEEMLATDVRNPGGYLVAILRRWPEFEHVEDIAFLDQMADPGFYASEQRRRHYAPIFATQREGGR